MPLSTAKPSPPPRLARLPLPILVLLALLFLGLGLAALETGPQPGVIGSILFTRPVDASDEAAVGELQLPLLAPRAAPDGTGGRLELDLTVTNPDPGRPVRLTRVDLVDANGAPVQALLESPRNVPPRGAASFVAPSSVTSGALGVVVQWRASAQGIEPRALALLAGVSGGVEFAIEREASSLPLSAPAPAR
jgi:hypothetical protein